MKTLRTIQTLFRLGRVLSKLAFIAAVVGFCLSIAGLISLAFDQSSLLKIGGVTLHGLLNTTAPDAISTLSGWPILCAGEAVLAKFAELCFAHELLKGTPFTHAGAGKLMRLGILTLAISAGCAVIADVVREITALSLNVPRPASIRIDASVALGAMFMLTALLCRYGAEQREAAQ